jgi:hypothetical protein
LEQDGNTETMCAGGSNSGGGYQHSSSLPHCHAGAAGVLRQRRRCRAPKVQENACQVLSTRNSGASVADDGGGKGEERGANPHPKRRKWQRDCGLRVSMGVWPQCWR